MDYASHELSPILGSTIGRPESPALEYGAGKSIESAFRELIENKYFYQKVAPELEPVTLALKEAIQEALRRAADPGNGPMIRPQSLTAERLSDLHGEIAIRPWKPHTRHLGDDENTSLVTRVARTGIQPSGTPDSERNINFYLPAVHLMCPSTSCKKSTTFTALRCSGEPGFGNPFPLKNKPATEQVFTIVYRCESCRESIFTVLVRRQGMSIHLCGFAPRRPAIAVTGMPESLLPILTDADQSVAEGDVYAAFYHLPTLLEHYMKAVLKIEIPEQIRGDDLIERYNKSLPTGVPGLLPPMSTAWAELSLWLHTRTGDAEQYAATRTRVCKHIVGVLALDIVDLS